MTEQSTTSAIQDLTGDYSFDVAHSRLGFTARHAMVTKVRGSFQEFEGSAHLDAGDPAKSSATLTIKTVSITTGQEQRDAHLRTNDFLDVVTYPDMTFVSTAVEPVDETNFRVVGDLTLKDVTKSVTIDVEYTGSSKDPYGNMRAGFEGTSSINRKDWGVTFNVGLETGGVLVSDKVNLEFDISAIKLTPTA